MNHLAYEVPGANTKWETMVIALHNTRDLITQGTLSSVQRICSCTYSRGHNKVPVPFASPFRATVLTVSVPFPFRVRVWPRVCLNGGVCSVFLGCCGKV